MLAPGPVQLNASNELVNQAIDLSTDVTGNLPVSRLNSGTGATSSTYWRGDGTWASISSLGTVTSVGLSVPATSIFGVTGSPVTTSGTLGLTTTGTSGGIPYFSSSSQLASSAALTANRLVLGGGAGAAPTVAASLGTTTTVLHGNAAGAPTFGAVSLTADVSGVLPLANGGTNKNMTAAAGGVVWTDSDSQEVTAAGTAGQYLQSNGTSAPAFASFTAPTVQIFASGSGTYTTPAGVLWIEVTMVGAGGGGGGGGTAPGAGGTGGTTTFGSSLLTATGGVGGNGNTNGAGGTATINSPAINLGSSTGQAGGPNFTGTVGVVAAAGGSGGQNTYGGAGVGVISAAGMGAQGAGSGGGGGGTNGAATNNSGSGGGAGGYVHAIIRGPSSSYAYAVGAASSGGTTGTNGFAGGAGAVGLISVTEHYQ